MITAEKIADDVLAELGALYGARKALDTYQADGRLPELRAALVAAVGDALAPRAGVHWADVREKVIDALDVAFRAWPALNAEVGEETFALFEGAVGVRLREGSR